MSGLVPGADPPMVVPYCQLCGMPVERFCMDVVKSAWTVGIHAQCCGRTSSIRISTEDVKRLQTTNEKLFVITSKSRSQGIRALPKTGLDYERAK